MVTILDLLNGTDQPPGRMTAIEWHRRMFPLNAQLLYRRPARHEALPTTAVGRLRRLIPTLAGAGWNLKPYRGPAGHPESDSTDMLIATRYVRDGRIGHLRIMRILTPHTAAARLLQHALLDIGLPAAVHVNRTTVSVIDPTLDPLTHLTVLAMETGSSQTTKTNEPDVGPLVRDTVTAADAQRMLNNVAEEVR